VVRAPKILCREKTWRRLDALRKRSGIPGGKWKPQRA
jgi:hypothetical protein